MSDARSTRLTPLDEFLFRLSQDEPIEWAERLRHDQRARWHGGQRVCVEDYLDGLPGLADQPDAILDLVYGEVLLRESVAEHPSLEELQERFPAYRDALARQWEVHQVLEDRGLGETGAVDLSAVDTPLRASETCKIVVPSSNAVFKTLPSASAPVSAPVLPGYDILEELGRGGNGVVYLARQRSLNRLVAIKMIVPGRTLSASQVSRIRSEAELIARLQHPHIVGIFRVGLCDGKPYLVLEYVPGGSLAQQLNGQPWNVAAAASLVETLARTLAVVHEQGIVHRDLKPANVLLRIADCGLQIDRLANTHSDKSAIRDPRSAIPKIVDFGLAKTLAEVQPPAAQAVTQTGEILGTPLYMAPEQAAGAHDKIGPATDQHALGEILYELLTGRPPFKADNTLDLLAQIAFTTPAPPSRRVKGISADMDAIVLRCLAKDPRQRYRTTLELAEDLQRVRNGFASRARAVGTFERLWLWSRRQPLVAALTLSVLLTLVIGLGVSLFQWRQAERARAQETIARNEAETALDEATEARKSEAQALAESEQHRVQLREALTESDEALTRSQVALAETERLRHNFGRAGELLSGCKVETRGWEWYFLARLCGMHLVTLGKPHESYTSAAFSPDGRWVAGIKSPSNASPGQNVYLWDARSGEEVRKLAGSTCVAFHPAGSLLASCESSGGIVLHSITSPKGTPVVLNPTKGGSKKYQTLAFSPDGRYLAALHDGGIDLWSLLRGGAPRWSEPLSLPLPWPNATLRAIAFRPDSKVLAVAARKRVGFWDLARRKYLLESARQGGGRQPSQLLRLEQQQPVIARLTWAGGGVYLVTAGPDGKLRVYDSSALKLVFTLEGHAGLVEGVSAWGELVASVSVDGTARVWDLKNRQEVVRLPGYRTVALNASGRRLLTAQRDRRLAIWQSRPTPPARPQTWHEAPVLALAFSPTSSILATGGADQVVRFHDRRTYVEEPGSAWSMPARVRSLAYHPSGHLLAAGLASGSETSGVVLRDVRSRKQVILPGAANSAPAVAFSPDGKYLAAAGQRGIIRLWQGSVNELSWQLVRQLEGHTGLVCNLAFGPLGRLASTGRDGKVILWNAETGQPVRVLDDVREKIGPGGPDQVFPGIALSPDGKQIATSGRFGTIVLWDIDTGDEVVLVGHTGGVHGIAYSPDGRRLATSGGDGTVRLWHPRRGEEVLTLGGHTRSALAIAFSADGRFLATSARDKTVVVHEGRAVGE